MSVTSYAQILQARQTHIGTLPPALCTVHNNSSGEVRYKRILMPVAMATESDDDTDDEDGW